MKSSPPWRAQLPTQWLAYPQHLLLKAFLTQEHQTLTVGTKLPPGDFASAALFFCLTWVAPPPPKSDDAFSRHQDLCLSWKTTWGAYYEQGLGTWLQMKPQY